MSKNHLPNSALALLAKTRDYAVKYLHKIVKGPYAFLKQIPHMTYAFFKYAHHKPLEFLLKIAIGTLSTTAVALMLSNPATLSLILSSPIVATLIISSVALFIPTSAYILKSFNIDRQRQEIQVEQSKLFPVQRRWMKKMLHFPKNLFNLLLKRFRREDNNNQEAGQPPHICHCRSCQAIRTQGNKVGYSSSLSAQGQESIRYSQQVTPSLYTQRK